MNTRTETNLRQHRETRDAAADVDAAETPAPRPMTFADNVILTIKLLAGFGLLGAALWGINLWTAPR